MADNIKLTLEQTRGEKVIFDLTVKWYEMQDWEANRCAMDIVTAIVAKSAEWDKALTGGPPTK